MLSASGKFPLYRKVQLSRSGFCQSKKVVSRLMWKIERRSSGIDRSLLATDDLAEPLRGG